ncbi:MAG: D-arabinono-1,4-lactone oxidase [Nocardioides sp.]
MEWRNWSGLVSARPTEVYAPRTTDDVVAAVLAARASGTSVKMMGTGHSFTGIAVPEHTMLLPTHLTGIRSLDREAMTVTAGAGTPLDVLNHELERLGLSLHNMGDIALQTLAGAVSTGTHGSGGRTASLSAQLAGMELVTGTGEVLRASATENADVFDVARVGLGALGVFTTLTFHVEPLFTLLARERRMAWSEATAALLDLADAHDHLDAYWFPHTDRMQVKTHDRVTAVPEPLSRWRAWLDDELTSNHVFEVTNRLSRLAPAATPAINEVAGRLFSQRSFSDVAHRVFVHDRRVRFKEMEYAVPREAGVAALREARRAIDASHWRISFPVEIRVAPPDDIPLSTSYGRETVYLAFHTYAEADHVPYFLAVERIMRDHGGRPHWGKVHTRMSDDLAPSYPRFGEFLALRDRLDPDRTFDNAYLRRVLGQREQSPQTLAGPDGIGARQ